MYHSSYRGLQKGGRSRSFGKPTLTWIVIGVFAVLFIVSVFWFRESKKKEAHENELGMQNAAVTDSTSTTVAPIVSDTTATLMGTSSGKPVGTATRSVDNNVFHLNMSAALPGLDQTKQFYEAWLVRPVPYDFIPAGTFAANNLGALVLDWNGTAGKSYQDYSQIVVTLQNVGGDADPQTHVVEGSFGK